MNNKSMRILFASSSLIASATFAAGVPGIDLEEVVVTARRADPVGEVRSASQGTVTRIQLETRPVLCTGELLETVPGLVVTQHSGDGKANQYFLRGFDHPRGWFGGARLRYLGAAPLIEDGSVRSRPTRIVNAEIGFRFTHGVSAALAGLNPFDSTDNDVTYFYESQLPNETAPVADLHFHPVEPRQLRATLKVEW